MEALVVLKKLISKYHLMIEKGSFCTLSETEISRQFVLPLFEQVFGWPVGELPPLFTPPGNPSLWSDYRLKAQDYSLQSKDLVLLCNFDTLAFFYRGEQQLALSADQYEDWLDVLLEYLDYQNWSGQQTLTNTDYFMFNGRRRLTAETFKALENAWRESALEQARGKDRGVRLFFALVFYRLAEELTFLVGKGGLEEFAHRFGGRLFSSLSLESFAPDQTLTFSGLRFSPFQISIVSQFYERILSGGDDNALRKTDGVFYTPPYLAEFLVRETLQPELTAVQEIVEQALEEGDGKLLLAGIRRLRGLNILDPSCGTGVFLTCALSALLRFYQRELKPLIDDFLVTVSGLDEQLRKEILRLIGELPFCFIDQLLGVDLDNLALEVGEIALLIQLSCYLSRSAPVLFTGRSNLKQGNSLLCPFPGKISASIFGEEDYLFDWQEQFPQLFNTSPGGKTIILANPPWGGDLTSWNQFILKRYGGDCRHPLDSFKLFLRLSMELLKEGERLGFLVPSTLLGQLGYQDIREKLLQEGNLLTVVDLGESVFWGVNLPCCLLVWQKGRVEQPVRFLNLVPVVEETERQRILVDPKTTWNSVSQELYLNIPGLNIYPSTNQGWERLFATLNGHGYPILAQVVETITRGIETGNNRVFLCNKEELRASGLGEKNFLPCFSGEQIVAYLVLPSSRYILNPLQDDGGDREAVFCWLKERDEQLSCLARERKIKSYVPLKERYKVKQGLIPWYGLNSPRFSLTVTSQIVLRQTSDRLIAAPTPKGRVNLSNVQNVVLKETAKFNPFYLIALLNSSLANFYYQYLVRERGRTFAEVKRQNLERLPLFPAGKEDQAKLELLAREIGRKKRQIVNQPEFYPPIYLELVELSRIKEVYFNGFELNREVMGSNYEIQGLFCRLEGERITVSARLKRGDRHHSRVSQNKQIEQKIFWGTFKDLERGELLVDYLTRLKRFPTGHTRSLAQKIEQLPIPYPTEDCLRIFKDYQTKKQRRDRLEGEVALLERYVDCYIYRLYGLNDQEIQLVEDFFQREYDPGLLPFDQIMDYLNYLQDNKEKMEGV
jgi:hypothetical protein